MVNYHNFYLYLQKGRPKKARGAPQILPLFFSSLSLPLLLAQIMPSETKGKPFYWPCGLA
jgi:hypothetical protein